MRNVATLGALVIVLAACGPAASSESGAPSSQAPSASSAPQTSGSVLPSFTGAADLEAWIPDTVAGMTMQKQSMSGDDYVLQFGDQTTIALLEDLGVAPIDASVAIGVGLSSGASARMLVIRAPGADSDRLGEAFKTAADGARVTPLVWNGTSIGGKQVETAVDAPATFYLYVKGDVLVFLIANDPDIAAEIMSGLP